MQKVSLILACLACTCNGVRTDHRPHAAPSLFDEADFTEVTPSVISLAEVDESVESKASPFKALAFLLLATGSTAFQPGPVFRVGHPMTFAATAHAPEVSPNMMFGWGGGGKKAEPAGSTGNSREDDFQRRQQKLQDRRDKATSQPKGTVEVTFPQKGNKVVMAKQGEDIAAVARRAGLRVKFDCKNGRCGTCQVRLNGRAAAKVCQGAKIPGGATRKLKITLDNP